MGMKWLKSTDCVAFDVRDNVARVTLNRPEKRNALSAQTIRELHEALLEADDRRDVNAILLSGAGKDFCAGYDLTDSYGGAAAAAPIMTSTNIAPAPAPSTTTSGISSGSRNSR
ncbi:enoyl-CoA hydratase-related protein [Rhizorhabdus histidinilytica]